MSSIKLSTTRFSELQLVPALLQAISESGFDYCTPIQAATLPLTLKGLDVAGQAQTGTGKTAAFLVTMFQHLLLQPQNQHKTIRGFILAPTRELAIQIHKDAMDLCKYTDLKIALVYGGLGYQEQKKILRQGVDILIGTPGRLIDYYKQRLFSLKKIEIVVLDEADRMFDLGFVRDVRYLLRSMPNPVQRLNLLFSATLNYRVTELAYELMNNPKWLNLSGDGPATSENVTETVYYTANEQKIPLLLGLLKHLQVTRGLIFVNTKNSAERVSAYLASNGWQVAMLSGDVPQHKRQKLLARFIDGTIPLLVATDIAARGLHVPEVSHVFNFDLPHDAEDYVHRIGRTARAGASGQAVSFACENYAFHLTEIQEYVGYKIDSLAVTDDLLVTPLRPKQVPKRQKPNHRAQGNRPSSANPVHRRRTARKKQPK